MINKASFPVDKYNQYTGLKEELVKAVSRASKSEDNKALFKAILDVAMKEVGVEEPVKKKPTTRKKSTPNPSEKA